MENTLKEILKELKLISRSNAEISHQNLEIIENIRLIRKNTYVKNKQR